MSAVLLPRRYYLLKRFGALDVDDEILAATWRAKQLDVAATALPVIFPARAKLLAAGYECLEDINGADAAEIRKRVGLQQATAEAVIAAATAALE